MRKVLLYSILLLLGLLGSQALPDMIGPSYAVFGDVVRVLTMVSLSFIMIHVGYEFNINKENVRPYAWDYFVAFTAASFPWIFVTLYFIFVLLPPETWGNIEAWKETLLAGRFASPTSAGVLFTMLAAAGLGSTWLFRKARVLAIFDDLDTVLLMIPLKMLMIGLAWQLAVIVFVMTVMLFTAYIFLHRVRIPASWPWVLIYSTLIAAISEVVYKGSLFIDDSVPIHIEVLLPAFVLGCLVAYPDKEHDRGDSKTEKRVSFIVAAVFMLLVGLSMPLIISAEATGKPGAIFEQIEPTLHAGGSPDAEDEAIEVGLSQRIGRITSAQSPMSWGLIGLHVLFITFISNLGKMFPALCYRRAASRRERLALAIGLWPRGEVGAGVLVISLSYGIGGPILSIAMLSLALNLLMTGLVIYIVKRLIAGVPAEWAGGKEQTAAI